MNEAYIDQEIYKFLFGDIKPNEIDPVTMPKLRLEDMEQMLPRIFPNDDIEDDMLDGFARVFKKITEEHYRKIRRNNSDVADAIDKLYGII